VTLGAFFKYKKSTKNADKKIDKNHRQKIDKKRRQKIDTKRRQKNLQKSTKNHKKSQKITKKNLKNQFLVKKKAQTGPFFPSFRQRFPILHGFRSEFCRFQRSSRECTPWVCDFGGFWGVFEGFWGVFEGFWPFFTHFWWFLTHFDTFLTHFEPYRPIFDPFWPILTHFFYVFFCIKSVWNRLKMARKKNNKATNAKNLQKSTFSYKKARKKARKKKFWPVHVAIENRKKVRDILFFLLGNRVFRPIFRVFGVQSAQGIHKICIFTQFFIKKNT
jgi:hypothetical protein